MIAGRSQYVFGKIFRLLSSDNKVSQLLTEEENQNILCPK